MINMYEWRWTDQSNIKIFKMYILYKQYGAYSYYVCAKDPALWTCFFNFFLSIFFDKKKLSFMNGNFWIYIVYVIDLKNM